MSGARSTNVGIICAVPENIYGSNGDGGSRAGTVSYQITIKSIENYLFFNTRGYLLESHSDMLTVLKKGKLMQV